MTQLTTARLVLRPARPDDAPCFALGLGDFDVVRWLAPVPWPFTLAMATDWLRTAPDNTPERALFMVDLPGRGLIGSVTLAAELGFWIARPFWGRGYGSEAVAAVIEHHFASSDRTAIASSVHHANHASLRLKTRLGFTETGRERRYSHALQHNAEHVLTRLTRADWQAHRALPGRDPARLEAVR